MTGPTKSLLVFAAIIWGIALAATVSMMLGNPTAINAVIGCSIPGAVITYWAWDFCRQDRRHAARRATSGA